MFTSVLDHALLEKGTYQFPYDQHNTTSHQNECKIFTENKTAKAFIQILKVFRQAYTSFAKNSRLLKGQFFNT